VNIRSAGVFDSAGQKIIDKALIPHSMEVQRVLYIHFFIVT